MERHIELTFSIFYVGLHICTNMIVFRQLFCDAITSHILTSTWTCMDASQHASSPRHLVLAEPIVGGLMLLYVGHHARDHMLPKDSSEEEPMWSNAFFFSWAGVITCWAGVIWAVHIAYRNVCHQKQRCFTLGRVHSTNLKPVLDSTESTCWACTCCNMFSGAEPQCDE
jgi:hypothetical protein